ncbi:MAG: TonB-dependent receptor [Prolixibacteraceae bacterium]|nr:TonB-dependent receptor [Prolixibacteraceae bacterium]
MRLTFSICLFFVLQSFAIGSFSQDLRLSINQKNINIENVLQLIEDQTDYYFMYSTLTVDVKRTVDLEATNKLVTEILDDIFKNTNVSYKVNGRLIALSKDGDNSTIAQQVRVSGKVTDSSGQPLPGVSVVVKGTTTGTITNFDGKYSLSDVPANVTLIFSFVGMKTQEISITGKSDISIVMEEETIGIEEVVAIGYGTMKRSDLTSSISSVKGEKFAEIPIARLEQQLQTQLAGLNVSTSNNAPGGTMQIRIRGSNSIQGDNNPLIIIDGMIGGELKYINANDVESVEVLKDASATAIYGSRGANGVIIVTTKKGQSGKPQVGFEAYYGIQTISKKLDVLNTQEWLTVVPNETTISDTTTNTDWQDEIFQAAPIKNLQFSLSGGSENNRYLFSANYLDQDGVIINSDYQRLTTRLNFEQKVGKNITIGNNASFSRSSNNRVQLNDRYGNGNPVTIAALLMPPVVPVFDETGSYAINPYGTTSDNPVALINKSTNLKIKNYLIGNFYTDIKFLGNFTYKLNLGYRLDNSLNPSYRSKDLISSALVGIAEINNSANQEYLLENTLNFTTILNEAHSLSVLVGATAQNQKSWLSGLTGRGFSSDQLNYYGIGGAELFSNIYADESKKAILSYLGRISYNFKDKYYLTASGRYDGASVFAMNNKWAFFPSVSASWKVTNEPFMESVKNVADIKLRGGYGETGSQAILPYQSLASYQSGIRYSLNEDLVLINGTLPLRLANNSLHWETTRAYNIGLDLNFFKGKVQLTSDYYYKRTYDLLYEKESPKYSGYDSQTSNIGVMRNSGFETELFINQTLGDFSWEGSINVFTNKNKVIDLGGDELIYITSSSEFAPVSITSILTPGQPLGVFYGYIFDGIYQNEAEADAIDDPTAAPGSVKFRDINGDQIIDLNDRTIIGDPNPDFVWGFNNSFMYKGLDLVFNIRGVHGNEIFWTSQYILSRTINYNNGLKEKLNFWHGEGTSNTFQSLETEPGASSTRYIENGSYIRLNNISLGYTIPKKLLQRMSIDSGRIYISAQNLVTITKYPGYDPEVNSRGGNEDLSAENIRMGYDHGSYPGTKGFTLGLSFKF